MVNTTVMLTKWKNLSFDIIRLIDLDSSADTKGKMKYILNCVEN